MDTACPLVGTQETGLVMGSKEEKGGWKEEIETKFKLGKLGSTFLNIQSLCGFVEATLPIIVFE